jgi:hypothetical protein
VQQVRTDTFNAEFEKGGEKGKININLMGKRIQTFIFSIAYSNLKFRIDFA